MRRNQKSPAEGKTRHAELDGQALADSTSRTVVTDLSADLDLVAGEAALAFAYLREALADLINSAGQKGNLSP
jgi:hypothetical protein